MAAIITKDTRLHNARQFVEAVSEQANTSIYVFLGRPTTWPNEPISAPVPVDTYREQVDIWSNMEVLKAVTTSDVVHAIPRYNWTAGNIYFQYNDAIPSGTLFDKQYYVMNSQYQVYKCLSNGLGNANVTINEPSGTGLTGNNLIFNTDVGKDHYIWKYMYTIPAGSWVKFGTSSFIPVIDETAQQRTDAANVKGIYGYNIVSANIGSALYPDGTLALTIVGDGSGASATATISNGNVAKIRVNNYGSGYTIANVSTNLGNAAVWPIVAPPDGHGFNNIDELGALFAMINVRFGQDDYPIVPVDGFKFRQVGLLKDPYLYGTQVVPTMTSGNLLLAGYSNVTVTGTITNSAQLTSGAVLRGSTSGANATVVSYLGNVINYVKSRSTSANAEANFKPFSSGETLYVSTYAIGTVNQLANAAVQPRSGEIIYVDNRNVITRATDQVEDIYVVLEF